MSGPVSEWDFTSISSDRAPVSIDTTVAHPARMYDYYLGGKDNFAADREAAEAAMAAAPGIELTARMNRAFLGRAVRFLAESGIKQIIDIGTGIPTAGNTHQVAHEVDPEIRVVYIDNDPMVLIHARALMETQNRNTTTVIQADLREPEEILSHPQVAELIDFEQPVAINLVAILHFIKDEENPREILKTLKAKLPKGSHLVISHCTLDFTPPEIGAALREIYNKATAPLVPRTRAEILEYFEGFELVEPGLVLPPLWRPEREVSQEEAESAHFYAGVGILR